MYPDAPFKEFSDGGFVGLDGRNTQDRVPANLDIEAAHHSHLVEVTVQLGKVGGDPPAYLALNFVAAGEPLRQCSLDGRIHGEERVGDDLQAVEGGGLIGAGGGRWAGGDDPGGLHLRKAGYFAEAADGE